MAGADNQFGPRVSVDSRAFDFTLLFEDLWFTLLPTACFLLCLPWRLYFLGHATIKVNSCRIAVCKLCLLAVLLVLQLVLLAFQVRSPVLHTRASLPAAIVNIVASLAASYVSFTEDQRSVRPSDLLVLYFSATSLCHLPRLRSLWLIDSVDASRYLSLITLLITVAIVILESLPKTRRLNPTYTNATEEERSAFWSRALFTWVLPFLQTGYRNSLEVEDVPQVDTALQGQASGDRLRRTWHSEGREGKFRLIKAVFRAYGLPCISAVPPRLAYSCFIFTQPFLITAAIDYIRGTPESEPKVYGAGLVGAYTLVYGGIAVAQAVYWRQTYRLLTMMRAGLISMIYDQTTGMTAAGLSDSAAITLMGTDVERIVANLKNLHEAWACVIELGVAIWLLERQIGIACFIPLVVSLGAVIAMIPISSRSGHAQKQWVERVQKRLAVTANVLNNMKAVQMLGLNDVLLPLVSHLRRVEVQTSVRFRKLLIWQVALSNLPVVFAPFATFTVYAIIALARHDESILSAQAFTSLALISLMTGPLLNLCQVMPAIWQAIACFDRIEAYCKQPSTLRMDEEAELQQPASEKPNPFLLSFQNATISWSLEQDPVFRDMSLNIPRGVTMIVGPVGCGKSTLLEAMLHKHMVKTGSRIAYFSRAAYCPQAPWILNDTIRNNIIGFQEFDQTWYDIVCTACGLQEDIEKLEEGDRHIAGSDGISLSGGQRQRIALARAVYSKIGVVVLDNVFSGIDSKNIAIISCQLFGRDSYFRKEGISVVLAMSTYEMLPLADQIVMMQDGAVIASGSYNEIIARDRQVVANIHEPEKNVPLAPTTEKAGYYPTYIEKKQESEIHVQISEDGSPTRTKHQGPRPRPVYKYYVRSAGYGLVAAFLAFTFIEAFCNSFQTLWLQWWVKANEDYPNKQLGMYLGIYGMIFGMTLLTLVAGCWLLFVRGLNNTSLKLHFDLLKTALEAPISFFQRVDTGSITNRFGQDLELIDMMLPIYAVNCITNMIEVSINIVIICIVGKYLAVTIPFLGVLLFFIQSYYLQTSRQVRLLDIEAKAPLYTHFLETIRGISSIRSFGWEPQLREKNHALLDRSQRPFYMMYSVQQWLTLVLDLVVGAIAVILIAIIVSLRDRLQAATIGVALNLVLTLNQSLANAIKMWTMTEISIGAVTRVLQFTQDTPSEEEHCVPIAQSGLSSDWPERGAVEISGLTAGYRDSQSTIPILKNLNISIQPGEKIAICGPSGCGKTSLIMAILQMLDVQDGRILIDGQDITKIPRSTLRTRINVVPQEPFFIADTTLRFNLDPRHDVPDDAELIQALEKVRLWERIRAKGGLDMEFAAADWSVGQKQLLALARALVSKRQLLILDEVTSSVDWETEKAMQDIIDREFSQKTVIAVVHRFRFIHWFDRVMVLRQGELVECGSAEALLQRGESEFRRL
ncbi:Cyclic peptide transporter [Aspergillus mulundensis]|uniref:Cyclic peptide transporter n=1 Tax=Aspergillus mulundensis TaxID=1810919 RepID=A0A3D8S5F1_9EURO|nr:Cyclic peptide transporter [Aspergillus mulundensis]RDW81522.1 Cyclic peptide transporter [Aspergillus mulundensis]